MLNVAGAADVDELFDEIPAPLQTAGALNLPPGLLEGQMLRHMDERARQNNRLLSFIGAGAYEHHIPAAVWDLVARGEFMTSYTPYQAEASQGLLQTIYEFQSMICSLTGMEVANASVYDGASGLTEAALMAVRVNRRSSSRKILCCGALHPNYLATMNAILRLQDIAIEILPVAAGSGVTDLAALDRCEPPAALIIPQPNFFGCIENPDPLVDWAHARNALVIAVVNPILLALLTPPGLWGQKGADIVVGEGQPLGIPLSFGGPYFGFLCCPEALVRQMPGRLVGRTVDLDGKPGFTLTLQAREQHIRRGKATSNICTNQGLMVTAATIYLALLGAAGLRRVAVSCHARARELAALLTAIPGVSRAFSAPFFHEFALRLPGPADGLLARLAEQGLLAGVPLQSWFPDVPNSILTCATETKTTADLHLLAEALAGQLKKC